MNDIVLSIIIPVYNAEKYLEACIESVITCKRNNIEVLLIDDGSKDTSPKICDDYAIKDKRIKIIHKKNEGVSIARNKGIELAKGKFVMFVDSDDILDKNWEKIFRFTMKKDIYYITKNIEKNVSKTEMLKYIVGFNDKGLCFSGPFSRIFKTEFLKEKQISFIDGLINGEDMLFNVSALLKCNSFEIINDSYYQYRKIQGSATKRFDEKIVESDRIFHQELTKILNSIEIEDQLVNDIKLYCAQMAVVILLNRIAYIKPYKKARKHLAFLAEKPYKTVIYKDLKTNKKFKIIFRLIKYKQFYFIYRSLRTLILIHIKTDKKNNFTEI